MSSKELCNARDFIGRREQEKGSYTRQKGYWSLQGYSPLQGNGRALSGRLPI